MSVRYVGKRYLKEAILGTRQGTTRTFEAGGTKRRIHKTFKGADVEKKKSTTKGEQG